MSGLTFAMSRGALNRTPAVDSIAVLACVAITPGSVPSPRDEVARPVDNDDEVFVFDLGWTEKLLDDLVLLCQTFPPSPARRDDRTTESGQDKRILENNCSRVDCRIKFKAIA